MFVRRLMMGCFALAICLAPVACSGGDKDPVAVSVKEDPRLKRAGEGPAGKSANNDKDALK